MKRGQVKWFNEARGYGIIITDDGSIIKVHFSEIQKRSQPSLRAGEEVRFQVSKGPHGLQARCVQPIEERESVPHHG